MNSLFDLGPTAYEQFVRKQEEARLEVFNTECNAAGQILERYLVKRSLDLKIRFGRRGGLTLFSRPKCRVRIEESGVECVGREYFKHFEIPTDAIKDRHHLAIHCAMNVYGGAFRRESPADCVRAIIAKLDNIL